MSEALGVNVAPMGELYIPGGRRNVHPFVHPKG
jgi:hypothetical protein